MDAETRLILHNLVGFLRGVRIFLIVTSGRRVVGRNAALSASISCRSMTRRRMNCSIG